MFAATRRWFRRNRTPIAVGVGLIGAGYVVTQYIVSKLNDARERMSSDRIAKENLRRRFQQNQEDCTYTVLALLPTAATKILETLDVEKITLEIQQMKGGSGNGSLRSVKMDSMSLPETTGVTDDDGRSMVSASESGIHASQITVPPASQTAAASDGSEQVAEDKPKRTKRQLWDDVTISSITRAFTLLYTLALLTMLTRVQLNLLGRRSYLSSVVSLATSPNTATAISLENKDVDDDENYSTLRPEAYGDDFEVNRKYLTFSWWLLNRGWADLLPRVEAAVRRVFGPLSPRDQVTFAAFCAKANEVRWLVEQGSQQEDADKSVPPPPPSRSRASTTTTKTSWLPFLLPPQELEDHVLQESGILDDSATAQTQSSSTQPLPNDPTSSTTTSSSLRRLLDETADLIDSPTFTHVLTQLLDAGFAHLLDTHLAAGPYLILDKDNVGGGDATIERSVLLPKCLSVLTRQAHRIGNGMPNEYLQAMEAVRDLDGFAAVVYSSNWENEIREDGMMAAAVLDDTINSSSSNTHADPVSGAGAASVVMGDVEESMVLVDPSQSSFESVWAKITTTDKSF